MVIMQNAFTRFVLAVAPGVIAIPASRVVPLTARIQYGTVLLTGLPRTQQHTTFICSITGSCKNIDD